MKLWVSLLFVKNNLNYFCTCTSLTLIFHNVENITLKTVLAVEKMIPKSTKKNIPVPKGKALYFAVPYVQSDLLRAFYYFYYRDRSQMRKGEKMAVRNKLEDNEDLNMFRTCLEAFYQEEKGNISIDIDGIEPTDPQSANKYIWATQFDMLLSFYVDYLHNLNEILTVEEQPFLYHHTYGQLKITDSKKDNEESSSSESFTLNDLEFKGYIECDGHTYPTQLKTVMIELFSKTHAKIVIEDDTGPEWCKYFKLRGNKDEKKSTKKNEKTLEVLDLDKMDTNKISPVEYIYSMLGNLKQITETPTEEDGRNQNGKLEAITTGLDISMSIIEHCIPRK